MLELWQGLASHNTFYRCLSGCTIDPPLIWDWTKSYYKYKYIPFHLYVFVPNSSRDTVLNNFLRNKFPLKNNTLFHLLSLLNWNFFLHYFVPNTFILIKVPNQKIICKCNIQYEQSLQWQMLILNCPRDQFLNIILWCMMELNYIPDNFLYTQRRGNYQISECKLGLIKFRLCSLIPLTWILNTFEHAA